MKKLPVRLLVLGVFLVLTVAFATYKILRKQIAPTTTIEEQLKLYGPSTRQRLRGYCKLAGLTYPPKDLAFIGLKNERELQVYGSDDGVSYKLVKDYPILGASGELGPKLKEGDRQVPEGFYRIELLQPNTPFHLALRVSYPSDFDKQRAAEEGRTGLGGDIMIHGNNCSAGCLAMGDETAEDLFVLVADSGKEKVQVILSPVDFRRASNATLPTAPSWVPQLYSSLKQSLDAFPMPKRG
jgi:murein L,D-transpeptidase YafK